jgi:hypothetical protein
MDEHSIIDHLEELAERFGIKIRYEPIKQDENLVEQFQCNRRTLVTNWNNFRTQTVKPFAESDQDTHA